MVQVGEIEDYVRTKSCEWLMCASAKGVKLFYCFANRVYIVMPKDSEIPMTYLVCEDAVNKFNNLVEDYSK